MNKAKGIDFVALYILDLGERLLRYMPCFLVVWPVDLWLPFLTKRMLQVRCNSSSFGIIF